MAKKFTYSFEVPGYGRSASDDGWETLEPAHIDVWRAAIELLGTRIVALPNWTATIKVDWRPILRKHQQHYKTMKRLHGPSKAKSEKELRTILEGFPRRIARLRLTTELATLNDDSRYGEVHLARNATQSFIHDFFLILNISAPGCCEFYRSKLVQDSDSSDLSLSNVHFELAQLGSREPNYPEIKILPLADTLKWFDAIRQGNHQLPQNQMEKALFALLHISKLDIDPMITIWIFYALESLLQTKAGENFSSLIHRIVLLLNFDDKQAALLRKKLRSLYDIRSGIVHGGFEVSHPMHSEVLDKQVEQGFHRVSDATDYGLTLLLALIQSTIMRGWKYPTFSERMHGVSID